MGTRSTSLLSAITLTVLLSGCEKAFTPKGTYQDKMVVYAILSNRTDTQYVRIYTTYDPTGFNPLTNTEETMVRGAGVTITGSAQPFRFQEGIVPRSDKSRYSSDIVTYVSHPFLLQLGSTYTLNISSTQYGTVTSSVVVPKQGRVQMLNAYVLFGRGEEDENIVIYGWIKELTYGVMARLYIIYDVLEGQKWVRHAEEIPAAMAQTDDGTVVFGYPGLRKRQTSTLIVDKEVNETFVFLKKLYFSKLNDIYARHPAGAVRVTNALATVTQVDRNLYTYMKLANSFDDPYSTRTDSPDFSNIAGGRGIFGAMVEDSLWVDLTQ
jgi:hypothetical protein